MHKKLSEKENYLKLLRGELPDWIPIYNFAASADPLGLPVPQKKCFSGPLNNQNLAPCPALDIWGVPFVQADGGRVPQPNKFILDDICRWRDVIKAPNLDDYDFERIAQMDLKRWNVNRDETAICFVVHTGYFQCLMAFMGFSNGLMALAEEPEECEELFAYLADFYIGYAERIIDYIKPDIYALTDDIASFRNPFISPALYRRLLKPLYKRQAALAVERGIPIDMHCCGRCEDFIDDWIEIGVNAWQPAQVTNNLLEIKKKYGRKLVICGGFDMTDELADPNCPREKIEEAVVATIDKLAPGGGYCFYGNFLGSDPVNLQKNRWATQKAREYGADYYGKNR